jgi:hypothetical protein
MTSLEVGKTAFRKRALRHSVNLKAWVRQSESSAAEECRVIDISRTGARLQLENNQNIPNKFLLLFWRSDFGKPATVAWRCGTQMGVKFGASE